jgi:hypothetical protein
MSVNKPYLVVCTVHIGLLSHGPVHAVQGSFSQQAPESGVGVVRDELIGAIKASRVQQYPGVPVGMKGTTFSFGDDNRVHINSLC